MTLILSYAHPLFAQHASDRLTSRPAGTSWDDRANKAVLVLARDGAFIAGYTGAANLGDRFTDEVMASGAAERDLRSPHSYSVMMGPSRRLRDVGQTMLKICRGVRAEADRARLPMELSPQIVCVGWKWDPRTGRSVERLLWLAARRSPGHPKAGTYGIANITPTADSVTMLPIPDGYITEAEREPFLRRLIGHGSDQGATEAMLVETIREVGRANAGRVGEEVLSVTLPNPGRGVKAEAFITFTGAPSSHGGYSPWILADSSVVAPSAMAGGWHIPFGPWMIVTRGPAGPGGGFESYPRR